MNLSPLIKEFEQVLGADAVVSDADQLLVYESDGFTIARGVPAAVVFPTTTDLVSQIVKLIGKYDAQIIPRIRHRPHRRMHRLRQRRHRLHRA